MKAIKSRKAKIEAKIGFLPEYQAYVDGVLAAGNGNQDDVIMTIMLWRLDAQQWEGALEIAAHALRHHLVMPSQIARDPATVLVEEMADAALAAADAGTPIPAELAEALTTAQDLTADSDMPDEVRAKAMKALGLAARDAGQLAQAIELCRAALELDPKSGLKTELNRLLKQQANAAAIAAPTDAPPATEDAGPQAGAGV
ncbi:MAG: terminase [Alphaproteobacteria bacterium]|nr:terminase [Alphaproteobacteria bacterium]